MTKSVPYHCPLCFDERGCGYHGLLRFSGDPVPTCGHHTNDTNAPDEVPMVPTRNPRASDATMSDTEYAAESRFADNSIRG